MDKTIETKFFEAFKMGGVVDKCIDWMRYTYNLPPTKPRASTKERELTPEQEQAKEKWDKYYRETLPQEILEATEAFDDSVIKYMDSPLMDEIEANLNDCKTDAQRDRYLFSLLKPFGKSGCNIAGVFVPMAELNRQKDQEQIDWVLYVNRQFVDLTCTDKDKEGSVERCLSVFVSVMVRFADRLDALLLTYGVDLMRLQRESGLYLKRYRLITDVDSYIGSMELAQKYIEALPKEPQPEQPDSRQTADAQSLNPEPQQMNLKDILPEKLKKDEAVKVFQNAIKAKLITHSPEGLRWNDTKQLLAYFATKVCDKFNLTTRQDKDGNNTTAWKPFEALFGVQNIKEAKQNWMRLNIKFEPTDFEKVDGLF